MLAVVAVPDRNLNDFRLLFELVFQQPIWLNSYHELKVVEVAVESNGETHEAEVFSFCSCQAKRYQTGGKTR